MDESTSELDCFSNLSSNVKTVRISSVRGILRRLKHNSKTDQHVVYLICKRIFRGLGASNPSLRQGCFTSVVGFLRLLPVDFDLNLLQQIIESELSPVGNNSKLEEGEAFLGQCLAYGAMIASDYILSKSEGEQAAVFEKLFQLSKKRSYLHHVAFSFLTMFLKKLKKEHNPDGFLTYLKDLNSYTLDKLNYILALVELKLKTNTIKKIFETKFFFDISNANKVAALLKKNKSLKMLEHDFYSIFVKNIIKHSEFLKVFWDTICDNRSVKGDDDEISYGRLNNSSDVFSLHLAKLIFTQCIVNENGAISSCVFNDKFLNIILRNLQREKKLIQSVLDEFCKALKLADDEVKLNVIRHILFAEGLLNFDNTTNSKTVLNITNSLSFSAISELANEYKAVMEFKKEVPKKDIESKNKGVIICLNFLTKIINNPRCCNEINWRLSQLVYLLKFGFFVQADIKYNREVTQCIQEAFLTSLGHRFPNLEAFHRVIEGIMQNLNKMLKDSSISLINDFTEEMTEAWSCAIKLSKKMDKYIEKNPANKDVIFALKIILQYTAILLLKEQSTAVINIQDLKNIFEELTEKTDNETIWIGVLIDLFLNLLSKSNYHHRHIIKCTFKFICPHLTSEAFLQIVDVLNLSYESQGSEDEDQDDDDEEEDDKEKNVNVDDESEGESAENSDEEEMDEGLSNNEKLRLELGNVLLGGSDTESIDLDDMDEDEGKRLDETLSGIFRANMRKRKTNNLSKYQNQLAHFRTRVMDLIEICIEVGIPLSYWVKTLVPLVDLFGSTVGQSKLDCLRSRISCCIKKLGSAKTIHDEIPTADFVEVLENLFAKVSISSGIYADMKAELVQVLKFLLKASKPFAKGGLKPKSIEKNEIFQTVNKYFKNFVEGKNSLPLQLFTGLATIGWDGIFVMIPDIIKHSFDENSKCHKKLIILKILDLFVKAPQFFDGHLEKYYEFYVEQIKNTFTEIIIKEINTITNSKCINNKYHSEVWAIIIAIIARQNNSKIPIMIDTEKIRDTLSTSINGLPSMKGKCKQNFRKLCNILAINSNKKVSEEKKLAGDNDGLSNSKSKKNLLKRKRKTDIISKKKKKIKTTIS